MPFNIELSIGEPFVKLQISKNTITLYFYGAEDEKIEAAVKAWDYLDGKFLSSIPGYNADWFRGPDAPHIKRNHTHKGETDVIHFHREFTMEVTPELLSLYLNKFWEQQNKVDAGEFKFLNKGEIEHILTIFVTYYQEYKRSFVETLVEEQTTLTREESTSYERALERKEVADAHLLRALSMFAALKTSSTTIYVSEENCTIM